MTREATLRQSMAAPRRTEGPLSGAGKAQRYVVEGLPFISKPVERGTFRRLSLAVVGLAETPPLPLRLLLRLVDHLHDSSPASITVDGGLILPDAE